MVASPLFIALAIGLFAFTSNAQTIRVDDRGEESSIRETTWERAVNIANATSNSIDVHGYNYYGEYPGSQVDGYTLSWELVGNYRVSDNTSLTGVSFSYLPPQLPQNRSFNWTWDICDTYWLIDYDLEEEVDPGCEGVVSDECYEALREMADSGECLNAPAECGDSMTSLRHETVEDIHVNGAFNVALNATVHDTDDFENYDRLVRGVIVSHIGFLEWELNEMGGGRYQIIEDGERVPSVLSCLRVDEVDTGDRTQEEAKAANVGVAWGVFVMSVLVSFCLL